MILRTMDYVHHLKTWVVPQYLRRKGILSEGWEPKLDRYVHRVFGYAYKSVKLFDPTDIKDTVRAATNYGHQRALPFIQSQPSLRGRKAKHKYVVHSPLVGPRFFCSLEHLAASMGPMRTSILTEVPKTPVMQDNKVLRMNGGGYLPGCGGHSILVIENLRTGKRVNRTAMPFQWKPKAEDSTLPRATVH